MFFFLCNCNFAFSKTTNDNLILSFYLSNKSKIVSLLNNCLIFLMAMYLSLSLAASNRYPKRNVPRVDYASIDKPEPNPADDRFIRKSSSFALVWRWPVAFRCFSPARQRDKNWSNLCSLKNCTSQTRSSVKMRFCEIFSAIPGCLSSDNQYSEICSGYLHRKVL